MDVPSPAPPDLNHSLTGHGTAKYTRPTKPAGSKVERMADGTWRHGLTQRSQ